MAYNSLSFSVGEVLTAAKMNNMQGNFTGLANGDNTPDAAPHIQTAALEQTGGSEAVTQACIRASAVGTTELKTTTGSTSTTLAILHFTMTGGMYVFANQIRVSNAAGRASNYGGDVSNDINPYTQSTSFVTRMAIGAQTTYTAYCQYRYVQASPPYDMGDGDIPLFIFVLMDKGTGKPIAVSIAEDPVWAHNGPTQCMPDMIDEDGTKYRFDKIVDSRIANLPIHERLTAINELEPTRVEITQELLHRDMNAIPHPFDGNDLTDKVVVLLDPVCDTMHKLKELRNTGETIEDLFYEDFMNIGNEQLNRVTPNGVLIPSINFK